MQINIINNAEDFKNLKEEWNNLLKGSNCWSIFLTWEWLYYWWIHFKGSNKKLFILVVKDIGTEEPVGIAPLCVEKTRFMFLGKLKIIKFLGVEKVASDFLNIIIKDGYEDKVLRRIFHFLENEFDGWDVLRLDEIEEDSFLPDRLKKHFFKKFRLLENDLRICPYIKLPSSYKEFLGTLSASMRSHIKRKIKNLDREALSLRIIEKPEEISGNLKNFFDLHEKRLNSKNKQKTESSFAKKAIMKFHSEVAEKFLLNGWLRFYTLLYGNDSIGYLYNFQYKDRTFFYQSGFEPSLQHLSPGVVMINSAIKDSINDTMSEFHYLRGDEKYKFKWAREIKKTKQVGVYKKTYLVDAYWLWSLIFQNIKRIMPKRLKSHLRILLKI